MCRVCSTEDPEMAVTIAGNAQALAIDNQDDSRERERERERARQSESKKECLRER